MKSPSEFMELATEHAGTQTTALTEQTKELTALAQKVALATTEPLKAGSPRRSTKPPEPAVLKYCSIRVRPEPIVPGMRWRERTARLCKKVPCRLMCRPRLR